jgi:hypothetical protein
VPLETAPQLSPGREFRHRKEAPLRQRHIENRACMSLAENEPVPLVPAGPARVDVELVEIQRGHDLGRGQGAPGMPLASVVDHFQGVDPQLARRLYQFADQNWGVRLVDHVRFVLLP